MSVGMPPVWRSGLESGMEDEQCAAADRVRNNMYFSHLGISVSLSVHYLGSFFTALL